MAIFELEKTIHPPSISIAERYKLHLWSNMNEIFYPQPQENDKIDGGETCDNKKAIGEKLDNGPRGEKIDNEPIRSIQLQK